MRNHPSRRLLALLALAALVACAGCLDTHERRQDARSWRGRRGHESPAAIDLEGRSVRPMDDPRSKAIVLIFVRTDCPVSNRYTPEIRRLNETFASRGVAFWLVYCDPDETPEAIRAHLRDYGHEMRALRDPEHALVRASEVSVTPEAAVFVPGRSGSTLAYRGRIDDRYVDFGRMRATPTIKDLERALEAILSGHPVERRRTRAVGCFIADRR